MRKTFLSGLKLHTQFLECLAKDPTEGNETLEPTDTKPAIDEFWDPAAISTAVKVMRSKTQESQGYTPAWQAKYHRG